MPDLDLQAPARATKDAPRLSWTERLRPYGERLVLWLHRQADRMDLIPDDFGKEAVVDDTDGGSLAREWLRQARLWAGYNPEEMLAIKAGAVALGVALLVIVILIRALT